MKKTFAVILAALTALFCILSLCSCTQTAEDFGNKLVNKAESYLKEEFTYEGDLSEAGSKVISDAEKYLKEELDEKSTTGVTSLKKVVDDAQSYISEEFGLN